MGVFGRGFLFVLWGVMGVVSVDHFTGVNFLGSFSTYAAGYLAWITFASTVWLLGKSYRKFLLGVFTCYFLAGYAAGPFLEPPADPLDHLRNTYATCSSSLGELKRTNKGFWQYSMLGSFICHDRGTLSAETVLQRIDAAHGLFWGLAGSILFVVGIRAGLSPGWALFSSFLAFLFMGTNRFSYFRYYSFAPSFSSIWIFWLWIAAFFFRAERHFLLPGLVAAGLGICVIVVNHIQEAIFLALVCMVWVFLFVIQAIRTGACKKDRQLHRVYFLLFSIGCLFVLFVLPQFSSFRDWLGKAFVYNYWQANQEAVFSWKGIHIMGKIWSYRIADTLALFGFLPILLLPLFLWPGIIRDSEKNKWRILLLGLLPFLVYCIPLLHFIWLANCVHLPTHIRYYYRLCYASLFWLVPAQLLQSLFGRFYDRIPVIGSWRKRNVEAVFLAFCMVGFAVLSLVGSPPVYGKLDFIMVDSRKWWTAWQPMIERVLAWKKEQVETDYITGYVLHAVFDVPLKHNRFNILSVAAVPKLNAVAMLQQRADEQTGCLINLHGFEATWVPSVTGHWDAALSHPDLLYRLQDDNDEILQGFFRSHGGGSGTCYVYY